MEDNCAGKEIKKSMAMLSITFLNGCKKYSELALKSNSTDDIKIYNMSCIIFSVSTIESKINEWVSIADNCFEDGSDTFWRSVIPLMSRLNIEEKWDLIATNRKGTKWDTSKEPFQSFSIIKTLRNELVHYKGELLKKDEAPKKRIKTLMNMLGVKSKASFIEDDCSSWSIDLLNNKNLGKWIYDKTKYFDSKFLYLLGN